ncbi:hypothetical protein N7481_013306 [Penicillium waksmanii]|uniref:uncharacterized protein n=1 Tax=Penicillium waksmanii TaxID=69791 RepID=UPI002549BC60|nr:uncharacterized protein N7481_013306 [Penicillium waksmanii]KAJ5966592.1 hypothetical protein N7481_013306 [Penicillium waksmanii]
MPPTLQSSALALGLLPELLAARSIGNTFSRRGVDCSFSTTPSTGDTCETFADSWGIAVDDLKSLNPDLDCSKFDDETEYCVSGEANDDEPTKTITTSMVAETTTAVMTSSSTKSTEAHSTTSSARYHEPTQPGLSENCDKFHKVVGGDSCDAIEASAGISLHNSPNGTPTSMTCSNIWLDYYVCIHVPGATTTSAAPTPTDGGKPPTQSGIAANCDNFHKVSSGDQCDSIEAEFKITHDQFIKWNPSINPGCTDLQLDYNVCVHVPGAVNTHGPTPQMPNLTSDCKKYHKVTDGESCPEIQKEAGGITLAQFRK